MTPQDVPLISDQVMTALIKMFQSPTAKGGGVHEDALLALSTLIEGNETHENSLAFNNL